MPFYFTVYICVRKTLLITMFCSISIFFHFTYFYKACRLQKNWFVVVTIPFESRASKSRVLNMQKNECSTIYCISQSLFHYKKWIWVVFAMATFRTLVPGTSHVPRVLSTFLMANTFRMMCVVVRDFLHLFIVDFFRQFL